MQATDSLDEHTENKITLMVQVSTSLDLAAVTRLLAGRPENRGSILSKGRDFFLLCCVKTGSGVQPTYYPMGTKCSFSGDKAAVA
jgi:hypothetical protein